MKDFIRARYIVLMVDEGADKLAERLRSGPVQVTIRGQITGPAHPESGDGDAPREFAVTVDDISE